MMGTWSFQRRFGIYESEAMSVGVVVVGKQGEGEGEGL